MKEMVKYLTLKKAYFILDIGEIHIGLGKFAQCIE